MLRKLSERFVCLLLLACITLFSAESAFASPIFSLSPALVALATIREHPSTVRFNLERNYRIQQHKSIPLGDVLSGPKMHQELLKTRNRQKIRAYHSYLRTQGNLPTSSDANGIILNRVDGKLQLVDGHHRATAMLLHKPNATIADVQNHISDVWIDGVDSTGKKQPVHVHVLASTYQSPTEIQSPDGAVKRFDGGVAYDDPEIFSKNSAGRPLRYTADELKFGKYTDSASQNRKR